MTERAWNFSAGPATLPLPVLERARDELLSLPGVGASALEISHRSAAFERIVGEAEANIRELLDVPPRYRVLFLQGGASLQFAMVPMNLLGDGVGEYVVSGAWSVNAIAEARTIGRAEAAWDGAAEGYSTVPDLRELELDPAASYLHVTSNETIHGVQFPDGFEPGSGPPFVCDASSDFLARPIAIERYDLLYAGAQKNAGPAGVTIVLIREELLERTHSDRPAILDYRTHAERASRYNTPPVFGIYVVALVTRWLRDDIGGVEKMREVNAEKAALLYEAIDRSDGFYRGHARPEARSLVNVTFRLPTDELDAAFVAEAERAGLIELAGHRSVGGIRASIYNAMPLEGVRALRDVMDDFRARRG
jgi:phosphoserine aminotransferase